MDCPNFFPKKRGATCGDAQNRTHFLSYKPKKKSALEGAGVLEATTGFEPVVRALQAPALPLGHVAI